jgi:glycosyltransferase involved in cell wall biosynthesis
MTSELDSIGVEARRIRRIPNGVDCSVFTPISQMQRAAARSSLGISDAENVALYAGRLSEDSGADVLIDAWRLLETQSQERPWRLLVAGADVAGSSYRSRGERELRRATFVGHVKDVQPLLSAADVLVRPSRTEGMSNVVLEAMASGLPIVASDTGGLKEQVEHEVTGIRVSPGKPADLAGGMQRLLGDPVMRLRMGAAGRRRVEARYAVDLVVSSYENLYAQIVSETSTPI